jgi:hypothetical protein
MYARKPLGQDVGSTSKRRWLAYLKQIAVSADHGYQENRTRSL